MEFATEKWGGIPHYRGSVERLGEDEFGSWWWGAEGRTIFRGTTPLFVAQHPVLFLAPPDRWWTVAWWRGHPEVDVYVNISTVAVGEADRIVSTDLDLDVIRRHDGTCEIVDRDEFEEHQALYGYPLDVVEQADAAAFEVLDLVTRGVAPFDEATVQKWVASVS